MDDQQEQRLKAYEDVSKRMPDASSDDVIRAAAALVAYWNEGKVRKRKIPKPAPDAAPIIESFSPSKFVQEPVVTFITPSPFVPAAEDPEELTPPPPSVPSAPHVATKKVVAPEQKLLQRRAAAVLARTVNAAKLAYERTLNPNGAEPPPPKKKYNISPETRARMAENMRRVQKLRHAKKLAAQSHIENSE